MSVTSVLMYIVEFDAESSIEKGLLPPCRLVELVFDCIVESVIKPGDTHEEGGPH